MRIQMAQSYANARKVLAKYGATLDNVVEEVLYVTDMDAAFAVASAVRTEAYGGRPVVAKRTRRQSVRSPRMLISRQATHESLALVSI